MKTLIQQNAREDGISLGEASEAGGLSFGDLLKMSGAAAVGTLIVGLGMKGAERLIEGKNVEGDEKKGTVKIKSRKATIILNKEQAKKVAEAVKEMEKEEKDDEDEDEDEEKGSDKKSKKDKRAA